MAATSSVSGGFTAAADSSGYKLIGVKITVGLTGLQSQDTVAGFNVSQRDRIVQQSLSTGQYPNAVFTADSVDAPAALADGQAVSVSIPGQLTIHGTTKDVPSTGQAQQTPTGGQVVGSTQVKMTDFGVNPPALPITVVQDQVTLEFQLQVTKS